MTITQIRAFLAVVDTGSIREAAERLVVTESAVSASLSALQRDLGVALTRRDGRGITLTEVGAVYAGYVRDVLGLLDQGRAAATGQLDPTQGRVRIAAVTTAGEQIMPTLLAQFRRRFPQAGVELEVGNRERVHGLLEHHDVDLALGGRPPARPELSVHAIRRNELIVVAPAEPGGNVAAPAEPGGNVAAPAEPGGNVAAPAEPGGNIAAAAGTETPTPPGPAWLEAQTWLLREHGSGTRATTEAFLASWDISPTVLTVGSNVAVRECAVAGLGVTLVSRDAVAAELAVGTLVEVAVPGTPLARNWYLVSHPGRLPGTAALLVRHVLGPGGFHPHD